MPIPRTIMTVSEILVEFVSHRRNCAPQKVSEYSGPYPSGAPAIFLDHAARMDAKTQLALSRFISGLFRAMFAMKEARYGNEIHGRVST